MRDKKRTPLQIIRTLFHRIIVACGAVVLTLAFFLVLPLMQTLNQKDPNDVLVRTMDVQLEPPPPPPPEPEEEEEPEPEPEEPPDLEEPPQQLTLDQLALALNPGGISDGMFAGDFAMDLRTVVSSNKEDGGLIEFTDLDQQPRVVYQAAPDITSAMRRQVPATVHVIFIVDQEGRVENPMVQKSTNSNFNKAALNAIKQWKFEPGQRNGEPVRFRMRVPITFPETLKA